MKRRQIQKKSKSKKLTELDKLEEMLTQHPVVVAVENTDLKATLIKAIRNEIKDTTTLMVKKGLLLMKYDLKELKDKNFILVFTNSEGLEKLKTFEYESFLEEGDVCPEEITIGKGIIKDRTLAEQLPTLNRDNLEHLEEDFKVCSAGEKINEKQSEILKLLKNKLKTEPIKIIAVWDSEKFKSNKLIK